jgi:DNA polymerase III subunit alpha
MKSYIPLHVHTHYSLLDGLSKPDQIADRCSKIGASSCAITDHGNIAGAVKFHNTMSKAGIKPILGCELYICEKDATIKNGDNKTLSHLVVLAKNYNGWKTLIKIVSESNNPNNYYYKPRLDLDKLGSLLDGNILTFSGHLGSTLSDVITGHTQQIDPDWKNKGTNHINFMKNIFGKDNFFLEAQLMDQEYTPLQKQVTECIRELGKLTNTKVVSTPDAHYAEKEDSADQRILLCNNLKTTFADVNRKILNKESFGMDCFFLSDNFHILSQEEINDLHTEEEIENTNLIDSMCEKYEINQKPTLPRFDCPNSMDEAEYLRHLCREGWKQKIANNVSKEDQNTYVDRIKYELEVLQGAGLSSYFLIVQDIVNYVRQNSWLPGPGRGSAAGCLVSYLIGITAIDPLKYNLIFDRFYNSGRNSADRISMPDIDIDVPINKREDIISYIKNKYGQNKVSQMITFNTMKGRGALKDVLRVYGNITFEEMNNITKFIPDEAKIADELQEMKEDTGEASIIRWALENNRSDLEQWCYIDDNNTLSGPLAKRFEQAIRLEGTKTNQSKHAAGIAISPHPLGEICPMVYDNKNDQSIAGMEMQDLESLGIVKFDVLGVAMLDKIMAIQELLHTKENVDYVNTI